MELFVAANIACCLISLGCIVLALAVRREALLRPTFIAAIFMFAYVQCGSALISVQVYQTLGLHWHYWIATQLVPTCAFLFSLFAFTRPFETLARGLTLPDRLQRRALWVFLAVLMGVIYGVLTWYLSVVPFQQTGLYAIITENLDADLVREETFKQLDKPLLLYAFTLVEKGVAPVAAGIAALLTLSAIGRRSYVNALVFMAVAVAAAVPAAIYGARGPVTMILLVALAVPVYWVAMKSTSKRAQLAILLLPVLAMAPIVGLAMIKSNPNSVGTIVAEISNIVDRMIVRGNVDNVWHVQYIERFGFHGISAIPKISVLFGHAPVDILNVVGRFYGESYYTKFISSTTASASLPILNFVTFGPIGHVVSLFFILSLDFGYFFYRRIPPYLIISSAAAMTVPLSAISFSMLTTVLVSKGLLIIPAILAGYGLTRYLACQRGGAVDG